MNTILTLANSQRIPDCFRILLIDDDPADRLAVRWALKKSEYDVQLIDVSDEKAALYEITCNAFDCILLDFRLAGTDGLSLLKKINASNSIQTPVVMLSGVSDDHLIQRCLQEGAQDYLLKSELSAPTLVRAIRYAKERKQINDEMRYIAYHDHLTGLASRSLFLTSLQHEIDNASRKQSIFAVLFIDVDNFKSINDSLGHYAGDELLKSIAKTLKQVARSNDVVGRLAGDEFAILLNDINDESDIIQIADRLLQAGSSPIPIDGHEVLITLSVGIATYPSCAQVADELLKCADLAMYSAKHKGKNGYSFYSEELEKQSKNQSRLAEDIRIALQEDQFEVYYQPQVCAQSRRIVGIEALIRWHHPLHGMMTPDQFIPVAERTGLIIDIGNWVVRRTFKQYREWFGKQGKTPTELLLSINISASELRDEKLLELVSRIAVEESMPLDLLEIELTEHAVIKDISRCALKLEQLVDKGIRLAIDDFGTGYASLRHLQKLPVQTLKIDRTFVMNLPDEAKSLEIIKAIIAMGRALDLRVIAEGVETALQADLLTELGCDLLQGYFFSRPMAIEKLQLA